MPITSSSARALFTKMLIAVLQERPVVTSMLRSQFRTVIEPVEQVSIEVERMGEMIAVDVLPGTEGNRNTFDRFTEHTYKPPLYREFFAASNMDLYKRVLGAQGSAQAPLFTALLNKVGDRMKTLSDKIQRAEELQCAQVLDSGIITLKNADRIDYNRRSESLVDPGAGNYFTNDDVDPYILFENGCKFMREYGLSGDTIFNAILGADTLPAFYNNRHFIEKQKLVNVSFDSVQGPVRDNNRGASYHGMISTGSYKVQLWSYPQSFQKPNKERVPYINPKKVVMLPLQPNLVMAYGAVPQLIGEPGQLPVQGQYVYGEFTDMRKATHEFDVQSAPLAIPVAIDQIYTLKAVA
jgi:hypothetical protein